MSETKDPAIELPPAPRLGVFTPELKDQLLIQLLKRNGGKVKLDMLALVRDGEGYIIKMRRDDATHISLALEKKQ